jgi:hypothetical protein
VQVLSIPKNLKFTWPRVPENNYIDTLVHAKLRKLRIAPVGVVRRRDVSARCISTSRARCPRRRREENSRRSRARTSARWSSTICSAARIRRLWVMKWAELAPDSQRGSAGPDELQVGRCSTSTGSRTRSHATCRSMSW